MLSLKIEYEVPEDRTLHVQLPKEIKPGKHQFVLVVDEGETLEISGSVRNSVETLVILTAGQS